MDLSPIPIELFPNADLPRSDHCIAAEYLKQIHDRSRDCAHQYSWGVNIYRTVYTPESDTLFPLAVARIETYMKFGTLGSLSTPQTDYTERSEKEIASRLVNIIIQDRQLLDNVSMETVLSEFEKWVENQNCTRSYNTRYRIALVLDAESTDDIMKLPETPDRKTGRLMYCDLLCKAVSRWGINHDQPTPWLYIMPVVFTQFWFQVMDQEIHHLVFQAESDPLVFVQKTMLFYRRQRVGEKQFNREGRHL